MSAILQTSGGILVPNCHDQLHASREGGVLEAAQHIPTAKIVDLDDTFVEHDEELPVVTGAVRRFQL
jgi:hypothetical protein